MTTTLINLLTVGVYLLLLGGIGVWSFRQSGRDPVSYFLADRGLQGLVLTLTMLATLLSAFTFIGIPADAYTHGLGIFLGVGVTDALLGLFFVTAGYRLWLAAREHGWITPSQFFVSRFQSPLLGWLYSCSALLFTAPYISIQIMAGARTLSAVLGIPYTFLAVVVAVVILGYVLMGGSRAVVWTDVVQAGILVLGMVLACVAFVSRGVGEIPGELQAWLSLPGPTGRWTWQGLISYQVMIFMAVPLFPQVFQRFYMAKNAQVFRTMGMVWPGLIVLVFFPATLIGVWGRALFPSLERAELVMPTMLQTLPPGLAAVVIVAALAALMSTADSQLLTASSLVTQDWILRWVRLSPEQEQRLARVVVVVIGLASFVIAVNPPGLIMDIATWSFQGSAMLFPILILGLYWPRLNRAGAVTGGFVSSGLTLGWLSGILPMSWTGGWLPVIPATLIGTLSAVLVSYFTPTAGPPPLPHPTSKSGIPEA